MSNKANKCDHCNSVIINVKRGDSLVAECSYCGEAYEECFDINTFIDKMGDEYYDNE